MHFKDYKYYDRLVDDYKKHGKLIVAFDYDNTIYDYHGIGLDCSDVVELLKECSWLKFDLVLFTVDEDGASVSAKRSKCLQIGIDVHYVNEGPVYPKSIKPYYNILLDDRAGLIESYTYLKTLVDAIQNGTI